LATPLAACKLVMFIDGRTSTGRSLAAQFGKLGHPWEWHIPRGLVERDLSSLRRSYLRNSMRTFAGTADLVSKHVKSPEVEAFGQVFRILSVCDMVERLTGSNHVNTLSGSEHFKSVFSGLLGDAVCFDAQQNAEIEKTLSQGSVEYMTGSAAETWVTQEPRWLMGE